MAYDVTNFLTWAASPKLEKQKSMGLKVILFLIVMTGILYRGEEEDLGRPCTEP